MTMTAKNTAAAEPKNDVPEPEPEDRVPAFKVGENTYTFPAHVPVGWALTYLRLYYSTGEDHALIWALGRLLGMDHLARLENDPALTRADLAEASEACKRALLGELEDPKES